MPSVESFQAILRRLLTTNATAAAITYPAKTATLPVADAGKAVVDLRASRYPTLPNNLLFNLSGVGADNATYQALWAGWSVTPNGLYCPTPLLLATCTLGTSVGVASYDQPATERDVDTIVVSNAFGGAAWEVLSNASNSPAALKLDATDFQLVTVHFGMGGSATSANGLYRTWG